MKILFDSQAFLMQKIGGNSRYIYNLLKYSKDQFDYDVSSVYCENVYSGPVIKMRAFPIKRDFKGKYRYINFVNKFSHNFKLKFGEYDIYHPTYYNVENFPTDKKVIITAHDFIHEIFPEFLSNDLKIIPAKKRCFERADRIIAISNNTKNDLLKFYPDIDSSKIDVVYHGIDWFPTEKHELSYKIDKQYILFTGTRHSYKNFVNFVKAIASVLVEKDLFLVCTGNSFKNEEMELFKTLGIQDRVYSFFANENDLRALYEHAICFVYPSLYEGFGLPILEAFASECPIVLSNTSCFPEVAENAGVYFDPYDVEDMRIKIESVVNSEILRKELVEKGLEQLKKFTLEKVVAETLKVYKKALESDAQ